MAISEHRDYVKRNGIDFKKGRNEKSYKAKTLPHMQGMIHKMYADSKTLQELTPIINLVQAIEDDTENGCDSHDSNYSGGM